MDAITYYSQHQYEGFRTAPAILEAIEQIFDGSILDDSASFSVWEDGSLINESRESVKTKISGYLRYIGIEKGTVLNWGIEKFIV
jgi:hypothetical protein